MENVTVIGGSGFLGKEVSKELLNRKYKVKILDLKSPEFLNKNLKFIKGDILDVKKLESAIKGSAYVYNFAGIADLDYGVHQPIKSVEQNILATVNMLNFCKKNKVKRYIYASTIYVYSEKGGFYRCSKQAAENYIEEFYKKFKLNYTILRYGSLYGPGAGINNGLSKIISNSIKNKKIIYEGGPNTIREYIHVNDAAKSSVDVLNKKFANKSIILKGEHPIHMKDLLKTISEILGYKKIIFKKIKNENHYEQTPYSYIPKLGIKYKPETHVDFGQGILQLIDSLKKN
jgi:UDP-glucose 4-epimerase